MAASDGKLDQFVWRDEGIERVVRVLSTKNDSLLVDDPSVWRTQSIALRSGPSRGSQRNLQCRRRAGTGRLFQGQSAADSLRSA